MEPTVSEVLEARQWQQRAARHRQRVQQFLTPHRARAGQPHPVWDFLFSYYSLRPAQLNCWHPGYGVSLSGAEALREYADRRGYTVRDGIVTVSDDYLRHRRDTVEFVAGLLRATAGRPAQLNCFGLHEWAMVYRSDSLRHARIPLRLSRAATDAVVDSAGPLRCTHFDAFRFFTDAAVPRNAISLERAGQPQAEQPGCLHANMDLYKWCYKLSPLISSDLLLDCLQLAASARELDMRASPYDLTRYGYAPIAIENRAGRTEYVRCQAAIAERAAPLRAALLAECDLLLATAGCG